MLCNWYILEQCPSLAFFLRAERSHLLSNQLVAFPEDMTPLGVPQDHPVGAAVLYHGRAGGRGRSTADLSQRSDHLSPAIIPSLVV